MSSRVVKWLLLASVLVLALPVVAFASPSRVDGLAVQGDYIKDYTNVYSYLSNICCVGNLVYGELGNANGDFTDDRSVGAFLGNLWDGKYGVFGVHLREEMRGIGAADANTSISGDSDFDPNVNTSHSFDIMWGKKFGTMSLGLQVNRAYARMEGDPTIFSSIYDDIRGDTRGTEGPSDLNFHRNVLGYGVGLGWEISPKFTAEGNIIYQSRTFQVSDTTGHKLENDGGGAYLISARGLWQWQPNVLVVPVFRYFSFSDKSKDTTPGAVSGDPVEDTESGWEAGIAGNWALNQNDLFILGASFGSTAYKTVLSAYNGTAWVKTEDFEDTYTYVPAIFAALETHVNPWLTLRFGAQQGVFYTAKYENKLAGELNTTKDHYSWFDMMLGAGVKLGTLQLDATLNPSFVHNGPYLISGESTSTMFPKVSATYSF